MGSLAAEALDEALEAAGAGAFPGARAGAFWELEAGAGAGAFWELEAGAGAGAFCELEAGAGAGAGAF